LSNLQEEPSLGVSLSNSSAGIAYVKIDSNDDVRLIGFPPIYNGSSLTFHIAVIFPAFDINDSDDLLAINEMRSDITFSIACRTGETLHPSGQGLAMADDNIGLKVFFQISSTDILEGSLLNIAGPVLGERPVRIRLFLLK
jgi:hypothetical protein